MSRTVNDINSPAAPQTAAAITRQSAGCSPALKAMAPLYAPRQRKTTWPKLTRPALPKWMLRLVARMKVIEVVVTRNSRKLRSCGIASRLPPHQAGRAQQQQQDDGDVDDRRLVGRGHAPIAGTEAEPLGDPAEVERDDEVLADA